MGYCIQKQELGGGIPKLAQSLEAVRDDSEGSREYRSNGAGPVRDVQGSGAVRFTQWKQELGGDWGDAQGPDGISPLGGVTDHGYDGKTWGHRRVVVSRGKGGNGRRGDPPHRSIHK